ncbi:hypothetical protein [Mycolicibacterium litorale]|uniref:Uncharacterized protein n=1 Tax=Mycolicibacterium litorale TaxID=758802 RepID=A0AAD1MUJ4_9MYCO|nr:hypothetical protein [Mycolicibacterium litorale]MCV7416500.1 hypothetical protein [Mycolicibacterium litorale]TDY09754.1 hypothetical protein BCL50_1851 [Mycolicibacterium litorale]BBY17700.1 hypothetical protein MLIT_32920 [Mycolicibacterium litorale]
MPTATPDNVIPVLGELIRSAAEAAADAPNGLGQAFDRLADELGDSLRNAKELPADVLSALHDSVDPPDWWSLLAAILLEIHKLDPDHLSVGATHPPGWSRMLTLGYARDPGGAAEMVVGLGITDRNDEQGATTKRGVQVHVEPAFTEFSLPADEAAPLRVVMKAPGPHEMNWEWAFGSGAQLPEGELALTAEITWALPDLPSSPIAGFAAGAIRLSATFASSSPLYTFSLQIVPARNMQEGIEAHLKPAELIGDSPLLSVADIHQGVSPRISLAQGETPQFAFEQRSLA